MERADQTNTPLGKQEVDFFVCFYLRGGSAMQTQLVVHDGGKFKPFLTHSLFVIKLKAEKNNFSGKKNTF